MAKSEVTYEMKVLMKKMYLDHGLVAVAKEFKVSVPTVRKHLEAQGVRIRGRGRPKNKLAENKAKFEAERQEAAEELEKRKILGDPICSTRDW
jgi:hypothetical protein